MIRHPSRGEDAFTGLELVILMVLLIAVGIVLLISIGGGAPDLSRMFPGGLVAESMYMSGDNLHTVGNVYGLSMIGTHSGFPRIIVVHEDPSRLGAVRTVISLTLGDTGAIDMDRLRVRWAHAEGTELLGRAAGQSLVCPNWTIANKFNLLPGRTADTDDWLEPNEQFELVLCPSEGARPYDKLTLTLQPDGVAMPLLIIRTVPPRIQPVMNLG
jgi:hypothetical protein